MPMTSSFFTDSIVLTNAINETPWTFLNWQISKDIDSLMKKNSYRPAGIDNYYYLNINKDNKKNPALIQNWQRNIKLKGSPFFSFVQFTFLHYPYYIDHLKNNYKLTLSSRRLLENYLSSKNQLNDTLSVLLFDKTESKEHFAPHFDKINSKSLISKWQKSTSYAADKKLIEEIYDSNLNFLDTQLEQFFTFLKNEKLVDNSIIIFMGDHGEPLLEHSQLHQSSDLFEENISVPIYIKWPKNSQKIIYSNQFDFSSLKSFIYALFELKTLPRNPSSMLDLYSKKLIFLRNCTGTQKGIRVDNEWKYINDLAQNRKFLFNLKNDPQESVNHYDQEPSLTAGFDEKLLSNNFSKQFEIWSKCSEI
jgi:hypothetical protein